MFTEQWDMDFSKNKLIITVLVLYTPWMMVSPQWMIQWMPETDVSPSANRFLLGSCSKWWALNEGSSSALDKHLVFASAPSTSKTISKWKNVWANCWSRQMYLPKLVHPLVKWALKKGAAAIDSQLVLNRQSHLERFHYLFPIFIWFRSRWK